MLNTDFLKVVLVGDKDVGKRSLLTSGFGIPQRLSSLYLPIEFHTAQVSSDYLDWTVLCYDSLIPSSTPTPKLECNFNSEVISGADAILLCYACDNVQSFLNLKTWYNEISVYLSPGAVVYLVGTKSDLEVKAVKQTIKDTFISFGYEDHIKTCALAGETIQKLFTTVVNKIEETKPMNNDASTNIDYSTPALSSKIKPRGENLYSYCDEKPRVKEGSFAKRFTVVEEVRQNDESVSKIQPKKLNSNGAVLSLEDILF